MVPLLLSPLLKPKTPFFSNRKPCVVVVVAEVGVDPPIRCNLPCSGGLGCVAVVAEWVWVGGLWWWSGLVGGAVVVLLMVVMAACVVDSGGDCNTGYVCIYSKASVSLMTTHNRKMLAGLEEKKKTLKLGLQVSAATSVNGGSYVGSELRNTPSGPDPLHHNGGSPKMPRTSP
ncbi:hypothetical protein RGQ29_001132 [Quercus rubra]|uniref:Uncharacterized protein n=1 Tax=Quercus rubra TaxID=3512 RepID=A0AAN7GG81_QUERU|nr:hypothetical protein RGQ29_001132 [Quercus rubra]